MAQQALSGCSSSAIDPDTVCVGCGHGEPEDSMLICDGCLGGFHLGCFGMSEVPEGDRWDCPGCSCLQQRLAVGDLLVLESPQAMYAATPGAEPHLMQGLYLASVAQLGPFDKKAGGRQVVVLSSAAPLPGSLRFFSKHTYQPLARVPIATQELAAELSMHAGAPSYQQVFLSSSRHAMFGSPAAAADAATGAWVAGPDSAEVALRLLAGPARQTWLLSRGQAEVSSRPRRKARPLTGPAAEQPGAQSSPPLTTPWPAEGVQRDSAGGPAQQQQAPAAASQQHTGLTGPLQQHLQGLPATTALPSQQHPAQGLTGPLQQHLQGLPTTAALPSQQHLSALPFAGAFPQAMGGQQLLPAGPWQWPFTPHPALQQQLLPMFPPAAPQPSMFMSWPGMWPGLSGYWPPGLQLLQTPPAAAAGMASPDMQAAAAAAGAGSSGGRKHRRGNSGQAVLLTEQALQADDDDPATSDDDFLLDSPGPAAAAGPVAKVVYKVRAAWSCLQAVCSVQCGRLHHLDHAAGLAAAWQQGPKQTRFCWQWTVILHITDCVVWAGSRPCLWCRCAAGIGTKARRKASLEERAPLPLALSCC